MRIKNNLQNDLQAVFHCKAEIKKRKKKLYVASRW